MMQTRLHLNLISDLMLTNDEILLLEDAQHSKLFNRVLPFRWHRATKKHIKADFHLEKNDKVVVTFTRMEKENDWELDFSRTSPFTKKQTIVKTGSGHALEVYSTVLFIISEFCAKHNPMRLVMWALESKENDSRVRLYDRMTRSLPDQIGYKLESRIDIGGSIAYVIMPKDSNEKNTDIPVDSEKAG